MGGRLGLPTLECACQTRLGASLAGPKCRYGRAGSPAIAPSRTDTLHCSGQQVTAWSRTITVPALCERLALLFQLEVPCLVQFRKARQAQTYSTSMRRWEYRDGRLLLATDRLSLHFFEKQIDVRYVVRWSDETTSKCVELRDQQGAVQARIIAGGSDEVSAAWQDIMDTFMLPLAGTE